MTELQTKNRQEKERLWRRRMEMAAEFSGTIKAFCKTQEISVATFQYWRKRLSEREALLPTVKPSSFVRVEMDVPTARIGDHLPDPKWIAEVLHHLQRMAK